MKIHKHTSVYLTPAIQMLNNVDLNAQQTISEPLLYWV